MGYDYIVQETGRYFERLIDELFFIEVVLAVLLCIILYYAIVSFKRWVKGIWESGFFLMLCALSFMFITISFLGRLSLLSGRFGNINQLQLFIIIVLPAVLYMHVRRQVSFKPLRPIFVILLILVPLFLLFVLIRDMFMQGAVAILPSISGTYWYYFIFYIYAAIVIIRAYLLCLNVFYQMPPHTRRSTIYNIFGISSLAILLVLSALWSSQFLAPVTTTRAIFLLTPILVPIALTIMLGPLFRAQKIMPAADVIVTSREFIMSGLSTTVFALNNNMRILDWNKEKKDWDSELHIPMPRYRETLENYRKRIVKMDMARFSPYSENIIIMGNAKKEKHYLMNLHEVGNKSRKFGHILETAEVTPLYMALRYFENIAYIDTLTGLYNRNAYLSYVKQNITEHNMPMLILISDIDYLKKINDTYGHLVGDELIIAIANVIKKEAPNNAFVARIGGDEIVMLLPGGDEAAAEDFVKNVTDELQEIKHELFGSPSISWGYSLMMSTDESYNDAFGKADAMMYGFKRTRNDFSMSGRLQDEPPPDNIDPRTTEPTSDTFDLPQEEVTAKPDDMIEPAEENKRMVIKIPRKK